MVLTLICEYFMCVYTSCTVRHGIIILFTSRHNPPPKYQYSQIQYYADVITTYIIHNRLYIQYIYSIEHCSICSVFHCALNSKLACGINANLLAQNIQWISGLVIIKVS